MTDILADYREWAANVPTRVSTHNERCHLYHTECMVHRLARRLEEAELTDAEREAVASAIRWREIDAPADGDVVSAILRREGVYAAGIAGANCRKVTVCGEPIVCERRRKTCRRTYDWGDISASICRCRRH
jgi:hypothetical protein